MVEHQLKGLCYNCDEKYFPGNKCKEQKKFMAISEDFDDEEVEVSPVEEQPPTMLLLHPLINQNFNLLFHCMPLLAYLLPKPSSSLATLRSSSSLTVETPIILFITALPKKLIAIFMQSTDFKSQFSMVAP
jgi:hypothetical protein